MASNLKWGVLSTISSRADGTTVGDPFGNPYSFADASNGIPYFFVSDLDSSIIDLFGGSSNTSKANPRASLALSEASLSGADAINACQISKPPLGDPENPPCARLVLTGTMVKTEGTPEDAAARMALFAKHPSFKFFPPGHAFYVIKLEVDGIWLISAYGGASIIPPADYFAGNSTAGN